MKKARFVTGSRGGAAGFGCGAAAAVLILALGVSGCGAFSVGGDVKSEDEPEPQGLVIGLFSGEVETPGDSAIDLIRAAAAGTSLSLQLTSGTEPVSFQDSEKDFGADGLVLRHSGMLCAILPKSIA
ncbi:MAG: hypothetical protein LBG27_10410 [Spirochaetaceae bacterium]|nr:hypothetical protein [Spirochaetaceae bacterium]